MPKRYELDNEMDREGSYRITVKINKKYILKARDWLKSAYRRIKNVGRVQNLSSGANCGNRNRPKSGGSD